MSLGADKIYLFEGFTLDLGRASLRCGADEIRLRPKSFDLLRLLVENAGRLVAKGALIKAVWPNVVVTEDSLTRCVSELREALRDNEQRMIKTVQRRGYLFTSPVSPAEAPSSSPIQAPIGSAPSCAPRLSVVVLPFTNLSNTGSHDYFVDGITDSLTTDLS